MRKIFAVSLMVIMLMSMNLTVFAASGGFIQSPSNNQAPELIEGENTSEDCLARVIITAYADRQELLTGTRVKLEEAYKIISANPDLSALNEELKDIANELGVSVTDFAVSDMFDISMTDCGTHEEHGHFDITLKADTLKNFVCLLHYYNNEWRIVKDAKVTNNGTHLEFDEDEFSPFAIVVNTAAEETEVPETNTKPLILLTMADISGLMLIGLVITYKKSKS